MIMATLRSVSGPALRQPQGNHPDSTNALWERIGYYESESAYLQKKLEASEAFRDQLMEALLNKTKEVRVVIEHGKDRKRDFSSEREEWSSQRDKLEERVTKLERKLIALKSTLVAERENAKTLKTKLGMALVVIQSMLAAKCDPNSVPTQQLLDLLQPDEAIDIRTPSLTPEKSATSSSRMNSGEFNSTSSSTEIGSLKLEDVNKVLNDYNEKHLFVTSDEELDAEVVTAVEEAVKHGTPQITNKSYIHYSFDNPSTTEVKNASFSNVTQSSSDSSKDEEGEVSSASAVSSGTVVHLVNTDIFP